MRTPDGRWLFNATFISFFLLPPAPFTLGKVSKLVVMDIINNMKRLSSSGRTKKGESSALSLLGWKIFVFYGAAEFLAMAEKDTHTRYAWMGGT